MARQPAADERTLRQQIHRLLAWDEAHVGFDEAVAGIPPRLRGRQPEGLPYSPWQLVEHLRLAQEDILDFCRNPTYRERTWPDDYWPRSAGPASAAAWSGSIRRCKSDRRALQRIALDPTIDLAAPVPHGSGQTYLRELLLAADHASYHVGELVVVRRLLGIWKA